MQRSESQRSGASGKAADEGRVEEALYSHRQGRTGTRKRREGPDFNIPGSLIADATNIYIFFFQLESSVFNRVRS